MKNKFDLGSRNDMIAKQLLGSEYEIPSEQVSEKPFLFSYHSSRRSDEGWGNMALVFAKDAEQAKEKLIAAKTRHSCDAFSDYTIVPDYIKLLNID